MYTTSNTFHKIKPYKINQMSLIRQKEEIKMRYFKTLAEKCDVIHFHFFFKWRDNREWRTS